MEIRDFDKTVWNDNNTASADPERTEKKRGILSAAISVTLAALMIAVLCIIGTHAAQTDAKTKSAETAAMENSPAAYVTTTARTLSDDAFF